MRLILDIETNSDASCIWVCVTKNIDTGFGEIYNVGTNTNYSILEIAKMISNNIEYIPARLGEAKEVLASYQKINKKFGWEPKQNLHDWIKEQLKNC